MDIVMETSDTGLKLVQFVRKTLKTNLVRIILLTGQPDNAPEREVIQKYEINNY